MELEPVIPPSAPTIVEREPPRFASTIGAVGGLLVVGGLVTLFAQIGDGDTGRVVTGLLCLLLAAGATAALLLRPPRPASTAAVTTAGIAAGVGVFLVLVDPSSVDGTSSFTAPLLFAAIVWFVLFFAGPARGRPFLLALALLAVWLGALSLLDPFDTTPPRTTGDDRIVLDDSGRAPNPLLPAPTSEVESAASKMAWLSLLFGAGYAAVGVALDRRGRRDVATALVGVGLAGLAVGLVGAAADIGATGGAALAVVVGVALAFAGASAERRGTTWAGGLAVAIGLLVFVDKLDGTDNEVATGFVALVIGAVVVALASLAATRGETLEPPRDPRTGS